MSETTAQKFKITVPITKCYLRKTADGVEKYVVEGKASGTDLDLTGERMADSAIKSMAKSLESHDVLFKSEHGDEWDAEFGQVTGLYATDSHELIMEAELDPDHYRTRTLVKALEKGKQLGLSIGGLVPEGGAVKEWVSDLGRMIKTYKDIVLEEISVTGSPAYAATWLNTINKSVKDWKETPMEDEITKSEEEVKETEPEVVEEAQSETETTTEEVTTEEVTTEDPAPEEGEADKPVEPEAPEQKEEPAAEEDAEKSAPAKADDDTSRIAKSGVLGDWVESAVTAAAIESISWNLQYFIAGVVGDEVKTSEEKTALIAAALAEFGRIVTSVSNALMSDPEAAKSFKVVPESAPQAIGKSLTDANGQVE